MVVAVMVVLMYLLTMVVEVDMEAAHLLRMEVVEEVVVEVVVV